VKTEAPTLRVRSQTQQRGSSTAQRDKPPLLGRRGEGRAAAGAGLKFLFDGHECRHGAAQPSASRFEALRAPRFTTRIALTLRAPASASGRLRDRSRRALLSRRTCPEKRLVRARRTGGFSGQVRIEGPRPRSTKHAVYFNRRSDRNSSRPSRKALRGSWEIAMEVVHARPFGCRVGRHSARHTGVSTEFLLSRGSGVAAGHHERGTRARREQVEVPQLDALGGRRGVSGLCTVSRGVSRLCTAGGGARGGRRAAAGAARREQSNGSGGSKRVHGGRPLACEEHGHSR